MASTQPTSEQMEKLALALEEATRATGGEAAPIFVEPAHGTLARSLSKRHHMVFGRRGSGKTSLLQKARAELVLNRRPNAFVDMEKFKGHSYPDVLISVLIETLGEIRAWLQQGAVAPASKQSFWRKWFSKPQRGPLKAATASTLADELGRFEEELTELLHAQDDAEIETIRKEGTSSAGSRGVGARVGAGGAEISASAQEQSGTSSSDEVKESVRRSKADLLHRRVIQYQRVLREVVQLSGEDGFLLLDDLYHIPRNTQAQVLDYFHRLLKGTGFWLKVGTIRHRSRWYRHGDPSIGMKLGDDVEEIDLDVTLEKYQTAKQFLFKILTQLAEPHGIKVKDIVNEGAKDRLVLASGGVARDFVSILRKSIAIAQERGQAQVNTEHVNQAAGEHESTKRDEFRQDVLEGESELEQEFERIKKFCLNDKKVNCFIIEKDLSEPVYDHVKELVDLRLLHAVASRVTTAGHRPGRIYEAYMIDISQYTGERKRRDLDLLPFWKPEGKERLRRAGLILAEASN